MDLQNIIDRLKEDRDCLSIAILALEKIASGNPKRRGRPRKTLDLSSREIRELEETYNLDSSRRNGTTPAGGNGNRSL
jgi:hypothetical protein